MYLYIINSKKQRIMTSKSWFGTLNNWTEEEYQALQECPDITYAVIGKEIGPECGTPHLHIAITLKKNKRLAGMKSEINKRANWQLPDKGILACQRYCKKDGDFIIIDNKNQGERSDLSKAGEVAIARGMLAVAEEFPETYIRYSKGIEKLRGILASKNKEFNKLEVIVFWGPPGSGKSRECREIDPDLYSVPEPINGSVWFDGYDGQESILLDDFYGWVKYHTLLQICDGYPMQMPIKGGFTVKKWKRVFITSNKAPEEWYTSREEIDALRRRITSVIYKGGTPVAGPAAGPAICLI